MKESIQVACTAFLTSNRILANRLGENPKRGKRGTARLDGAMDSGLLARWLS